MHTRDLVLGSRLEVAGVMTFVELHRGLTPRAVDHASPLNGWTFGNQVRPALHVRVVVHLQEPACLVERALRQASVPAPDRDIGDRAVASGKVGALGQSSIEHVELTIGLHGEAIDGVLDLGRVHGRQGEAMLAISTVDCALWDIRGKWLGQPVHRLLGGPTREAVPAYASMLGYAVLDAGRVWERAQEFKALGYPAQKWFFRHEQMSGKEGLRKNVELVRTVREAVAGVSWQNTGYGSRRRISRTSLGNEDAETSDAEDLEDDVQQAIAFERHPALEARAPKRSARTPSRRPHHDGEGGGT